jgi:hypothetical protein
MTGLETPFQFRFSYVGRGRTRIDIADKIMFGIIDGEHLIACLF